MDCPACAAHASPWVSCPRSGRKFFLCGSCGLAFLDPDQRLDPEAERGRYLLHRNAVGDPAFRAYLGRFIDRALDPFVERGQAVLDYGSGPEAVMASLLAERGWRASIWDPLFSPSREGLEMASFAAVIMHEVIEHCPHPLSSLRDALSFLAPGGFLCLSTLFRPQEPAAFLSWWYREDPTHISFFTEACLSRLCAEAGLAHVLSDGKGVAVYRKA